MSVLNEALQKSREGEPEESGSSGNGASRKKGKKRFPLSVRRLLKKNHFSLQALEGNLLSAARGRRVKFIGVTSARNGEGKTTNALATAYALTQGAKERVLLIDGNLKAPVLQDLFSLTATPGFSDYILGQADWADCVRETPYSGLHVMPHGSPVHSSMDVFGVDSFGERCNQLKEQFDYMVMDCSSVLTASDICHVAAYLDGFLLVVECERTKWEVTRLAQEKLENVGGQVLGVNLNKRKFYVPRFIYGKI